MEVVDLMTANPACCTAETNLQEVAQMMKENDCGMIPVVEDMDSRRPIGTVSDRDIVIRALAEGKNAVGMRARDVMSEPVITAKPETTIVDASRLMEENQVRRLPIVDDNGACVGVLAQADIALHARQNTTAEVVEEISRPTQKSNAV